jgi:hypothetical protein
MPPPPPTPKAHIQAKPAVVAPRSVHQPPLRPRTIQRAEASEEELQEIPKLPVNHLGMKAAKLISSAKSTQQKVEDLFREFLNMGFGYQLGISPSALVLGIGAKPLKPHEKFRDCFGGNCIALAGAFAQVLEVAEIAAAPREVRKEKPGQAFVVYAPSFIDPTVTGNVFKENVLWQNHYLFTNHTATWVPDLNTFYDPMAGISYRDLSPHIVMELESVASEDEFTGDYQGRTWHLVRRTNMQGPGGGFFRFDMTKVAQGHLVTPLGTFKQSK